MPRALHPPSVLLALFLAHRAVVFFDLAVFLLAVALALPLAQDVLDDGAARAMTVTDLGVDGRQQLFVESHRDLRFGRHNHLTGYLNSDKIIAHASNWRRKDHTNSAPTLSPV